MKLLSVSKPIIMMVIVLMIAQLACNLGREAAETSPAPSVAAPQATEAGGHASPAEAEAT